MSFKLAWWKKFYSPQWRHGRVAPSAGSEQRQPKSEEKLLARLRLLELTGNGTNSPFHGCHRYLLLLLIYTALLVGGFVALPWLMLSCWPTWGLRMICFSWGGFSNLLDICCLPSAISAFQQRLRQECVRRELRKRLRAALKGLNFAAFLAESPLPGNEYGLDSNIKSSSTISTGNSSATIRECITTTGICLTTPLNSSDPTDTCQDRQEKEVAQQDGFRRTVDSNKKNEVTAANRWLNVLRRRSTRIVQQRIRRQTAINAVDSHRTASEQTVGVLDGSEAVSEAFQPSESSMPSSNGSEKAGRTALASVKDELQHADFLRQQRAAAAVESSAAANARRLGLTTLADCRRVAGKEALSDVDVEELLVEAHVEPELLMFFETGEAAQERRSSGVRSWLARVQHLLMYPFSRNVTADSISISFPSPHISASAASVPSAPCGSRSSNHSALRDHTTAAISGAAYLSPEPKSASYRVSSEVVDTATSCSSLATRNPCRKEANTQSSAATPSGSSPVTGAADHSGGVTNSASRSGSRSIRCIRKGGNSGKEGISAVIHSSNAAARSSSSSDGSAGENISSSHHSGAPEDEEKIDSRTKGQDRKEWRFLIPWQLILRGLIAHVHCTYIVDLLFCHAQLSPLSNSVHRILLLLLHCFIRGLSVSLTFASPYAYIPYSSPLLARHMTSSVFMCIATSFGMTACLLLAPVFIEGLLQPLLRFLTLPESIVESSGLLLFVELHLLLPSVPLTYKRSTWNERIHFYAACQIVTVAVISVGAYTAVRLYDAKPRAAAAARRAYARDVLTLLALGAAREGEPDGAQKGMTTSIADKDSFSHVDGQCRAETPAPPPAEKVGSGVIQGVALPAASICSKSTFAGDLSREGSSEKRDVLRDETRILLSPDEKGGSSEHEQRQRVLENAGESAAVAHTGKEKVQQMDLSEHEQKECRVLQGLRTDGRWSLLFAERVVEERVYLEASDLDLMLSRFIKRMTCFAAAVTAFCLLILWASVAFLAVSNVAMRVNTPSDILQERNNVNLMATLAATISMFDEEAAEGFQDWAEDIRLIQEELRDGFAYYQKIQRERGWVAAVTEIWGMLQEEFAATEELDSNRRKQEMSAYTVLGVKPSATSADIKKAYKILAKQLHPDILAAATSDKAATPEELNLATERMRQINAAYEKLMRKHGGRAGKYK